MFFFFILVYSTFVRIKRQDITTVCALEYTSLKKSEKNAPKASNELWKYPV